jgi:hypothetical protein
MQKFMTDIGKITDQKISNMTQDLQDHNELSQGVVQIDSPVILEEDDIEITSHNSSYYQKQDSDVVLMEEDPLKFAMEIQRKLDQMGESELNTTEGSKNFTTRDYYIFDKEAHDIIIV